MIETKVTTATLVSLVASILLAALTFVGGDASVLANVPPVVAGLILAVIPPLSAFLGGFVAPHTPRPDAEL